jgi:nucleotide-binding universal stress UspA family protein
MPEDLSPIARAVEAINGHMTVVNVGPIPPVPAYELGAMPYGSVGLPEVWITTQREIANALTEQFAATQSYLANAGVSGEANMICDGAVQMEHRVVPHTFVADVAVIMNDLRTNEDAVRSLIYGIIFGSPIPLILNPTSAALSPERVLVAWNTSLPAARAIHAALPVLKAAKEVTLCVIDPRARASADGQDPGTGVATWLSHHGCNVTVQQTPSGGKPNADVILRCASETGADLVVMGAYGHSRMQQRVFGGTTRSMIEQTGQAVLLAH